MITIPIGTRVEATGYGKTQRYKGWKGVVTHDLGPDGIGVLFDDTDIPVNLVPGTEIWFERDPFCPCARCRYHFP